MSAIFTTLSAAPGWKSSCQNFYLLEISPHIFSFLFPQALGASHFIFDVSYLVIHPLVLEAPGEEGGAAREQRQPQWASMSISSRGRWSWVPCLCLQPFCKMRETVDDWHQSPWVRCASLITKISLLKWTPMFSHASEVRHVCKCHLWRAQSRLGFYQRHLPPCFILAYSPNSDGHPRWLLSQDSKLPSPGYVMARAMCRGNGVCTEDSAA